MIKKSRMILSLGLVGMFGISGCLPDEDFSDVKVKAPSPKVSLPLFNTTLTIEDMLQADGETGALRKNADESYSLFYETGVQSDPVREYFPELPSQQFAESFSLERDAPMFNLTPPPVTFNGSIPFDLNDLTIYDIESSQGTLGITISSDYQHDVEVKATFPNILSPDGEELVLDFILPYWNGSGNSQQEVDLTGYRINLSDGEIGYGMEVSIVGSGQPINSTDEINFNFSLDGLDFEFISGNFSGIQVPIGADTLEIQALNGVVDGRIATNPRMTLSFTNSYGVPVSPDFSQLYIGQIDGNVVRLRDSPGYEFFDGGFTIPYLENRNATVEAETYEINDETSNITEAFENIPSGLAYRFGFALSSGENDTSFVSANSQIEVGVGLELPLEAGFDLTLEDSIDVSFSELEDVKELKMLLKTENDFPIDANLQVFFLDGNGSIINDGNGEPISLFEGEEKLLVAAEIINSNTGETLATNRDLPLSATIGQDKFEKIREATQLLVRANLNSVSEESNRIKLYSFYSIRFSLAAQVQASFDSE
ncbi:MAG: hypothetical protein AAF992_00045 [Bacteroidota bacterium]